ncbi:hypothetical protein D9M68_907250 [compost metagenome]
MLVCLQACQHGFKLERVSEGQTEVAFDLVGGPCIEGIVERVAAHEVAHALIVGCDQTLPLQAFTIAHKRKVWSHRLQLGQGQCRKAAALRHGLQHFVGSPLAQAL